MEEARHPQSRTHKHVLYNPYDPAQVCTVQYVECKAQKLARIHIREVRSYHPIYILYTYPTYIKQKTRISKASIQLKNLPSLCPPHATLCVLYDRSFAHPSLPKESYDTVTPTTSAGVNVIQYWHPLYCAAPGITVHTRGGQRTGQQ
jgi:hypothetical protein